MSNAPRTLDDAIDRVAKRRGRKVAEDFSQQVYALFQKHRLHNRLLSVTAQDNSGQTVSVASICRSLNFAVEEISVAMHRDAIMNEFEEHAARDFNLFNPEQSPKE